MSMSPVPAIRIRPLNSHDPRADGAYVLYWMNAFRRTMFNFSLDRAVEWCEKLRKPLIVLEALRCGYPWASDRIHRFVLQGMADQSAAFANTPVLYYPFVEEKTDQGKGLLGVLAQRACVVVTDDYPAFFLPQMVAAAAKQIPTRIEAVDSNGVLPMAAADRVFPTAHAFRRFLQRVLPEHLTQQPQSNALARRDLPRCEPLPESVTSRWPPASASLLQATPEFLRQLPIDHAVGPALMQGGSQAGRRALVEFLKYRLPRYQEGRNHPDDDASSGLSPYLHFGHIAAQEIFRELAIGDEWSTECLAANTQGSREGWWGMSPAAESFLDELITWRELGFNMCRLTPDYDQYETLPDWAKTTLEKHAQDVRPVVYSLEDLEAARTHDPIWNAAQRQLSQEGRLHNYLRMLWGKKVLEWSETPRQALETMVHLNNKYAVDGRDPNSYSGIFWVLGRYDRAWGPERPIFGTVRYMSSENTRRKLRMSAYLEQYGEQA
jgi:deoxyribodipyrimidine photo-lyase